ncbi:MAG: peptidoglycan DD-metalloendopeptidase family protein [Rikenellaceae bacterium]
MKHLFSIIIFSLFFASIVGCGGFFNNDDNNSSTSAEDLRNLRYGVDIEGYDMVTQEIKMGQTMGALLSQYGITAYQVDQLDRKSEEIFPLKNIRGGNKYTMFLRTDSLGAQILDYMAYERNNIDYVLFGFVGDTITVSLGSKPTREVRFKKSAVINSSLWGAIMEAELPYALATQMEDVYQWTIDFFGIRAGDSFTVIYDEKFVDDSVSVGIGTIWGAKFVHGTHEYYAVPFDQNGKIEYWEADGASLKKQMLKAPLKYSRISSKFSRSRLHPVHKVYRPHLGVDYAAPLGTPVHSVANGVVTFKAYAGGGGNTVKIKHPGNIQTGYLHLSKYAPGIKVGSHVSQGQLIGYVGSTGTSTGPHLDYRVWRNGEAIDPLKIPQEPTEPISEKNRAEFEYISSHILAEINGDVAESEKIMRLDTTYVSTLVVVPQAESQKSNIWRVK